MLALVLLAAVSADPVEPMTLGRRDNLAPPKLLYKDRDKAQWKREVPRHKRGK